MTAITHCTTHCRMFCQCVGGGGGGGGVCVLYSSGIYADPLYRIEFKSCGMEKVMSGLCGTTETCD